MSKTKNRKIQRKSFQQITERSYFFGPLPPPDKLALYNQVVPNAAERIITMAENQSAHRIDLESRVVKSDIINSRLGLCFGFVIAIMAIASGAYLINAGNTLEGSVLAGATVSAIVASFVYGSRQRRKERVANQQLLQR